jgi:hypothetical protein
MHMASSGIRVGAWDYLKWSHVSPIFIDDKLVAAKVLAKMANISHS